VEERPNGYVDWKLNFKENGEITGTGVDPCDGTGLKEVEIFGYSYLNNVVITVTA